MLAFLLIWVLLGVWGSLGWMFWRAYAHDLPRLYGPGLTRWARVRGTLWVIRPRGRLWPGYLTSFALGPFGWLYLRRALTRGGGGT